MRRLVIALFSSAGIAALAPTAAAQTWIANVLPGGEGGASGLADAGGIVGGIASQGVRWSSVGATPVVLAAPAGATVWGAYAVNDAGVVVGNGNGYDFPTKWTAGVPTPMARLRPDALTQVVDINALGEAAGSGGGSGNGWYAIRWSAAGAPAQLPRPSGGTNCYGNAINDAGQVAGSCNLSSGGRAVLWFGTSPIVLGQLADAVGSAANDLDDSGLVVGHSIINGKFFPTRWNNGVPKKLARLTNTKDAIAVAINNSGRAVGWTSLKNGSLVATVWTGLNTVAALPYPAGTNACSAEDVDDSGRIAGVCYDANVVPFVRLPVVWTAQP